MTYKVLYISAVSPDTTSGGRFAMYRHLIIKQDFEVAVASTNFVHLPIKEQFCREHPNYAVSINA